MVAEKSKKINFFSKDNKGLSGIVTSLILIVLVLVAAGIVWAVYNSLIAGSADDTEFSSKCLALALEVNSLLCDATECTATLERGIDSNEEFDGIEYNFVNADSETGFSVSEGNIVIKKAVSTTEMTSEGTGDTAPATEVQIRIYFTKEDGKKYYCSPAIVYEP